MEIICATEGILDKRYPGQGAGDLAGAGFSGAMLDLTAGTSFSCDMTKFIEEIAKIFAALEKNALPVSAVRLYTGEMGDAISWKNTLHIIKSAEKAGCRLFVVSPPDGCQGSGSGTRDEIREKDWQAAKEYLLGLISRTADDTLFLLANDVSYYHGRFLRGNHTDGHLAAAHLVELEEAIGSERFGFALDVMAASLGGQDMQAFVKKIGKYLKLVIMSDCDGHFWSRLLPFSAAMYNESVTDWLGLIRGLRDIDFDGILALNFPDTANAFSPSLKPPLLALAKATGDYFIWQIGMEKVLKKYAARVLFGAGNMCRIYMKCYGEKYPPLFTVDNNEKRWGEIFCGLEIRPPEALKDIPDDCAVFICNDFYREVEAQLKEIGVKHIEKFNDKYAPSFYFERLEDIEKKEKRRIK